MAAFTPPGVAKGYAVEFISPLRRVVTRLTESPATLDQLAHSIMDTFSYVGGDLARIKLHEGAHTDWEAIVWLAGTAIESLDGQVTEDDGVFSLAVPVDQVTTWDGRKIHVFVHEVRTGVPDLWNPLNGAFSGNIRSPDSKDDLSALIESLSTYGWHDDKVIIDERGVVISGHRRLKAAQEAGVSVPITYKTYGSGEAADGERLADALATAEGKKPLTPTDRKHILKHLFPDGDTGDWSQAKIATLLNVSQSTISLDIAQIAAEEERVAPPTIIDANNPPPPPFRGKQVSLLWARSGLGPKKIADALGLDVDQVSNGIDSAKRYLNAHFHGWRESIGDPAVISQVLAPQNGVVVEQVTVVEQPAEPEPSYVEQADLALDGTPVEQAPPKEITVAVTGRLAVAAKAYAKAHDRSLKAVVGEAIEQYLAVRNALP